MDIDQRLEALTHTVELLAGMQLKTEEAQLKTEEAQRRTEEAQRRTEEHLIRVDRQIDKMVQENRATRRFFARIAADHELRLQAIEGLDQALGEDPKE